MSKYNQNKGITPANIMLRLAGILFCLVLITTSMMSGLYARYTAEGKGEDSARVATFGDLVLEETGDFDGKAAMIIPGVNLKKQATVTFGSSEVSTYIFVQITAPGWTKKDDNETFSVEDYLSWSVADGWTYLEGTSHVYYRELAPNTPLEKADIIAPLTGSKDHILVSELITKDILTNLGKQDLTITLQATAIQSGGFASAKAAWDYLK